MSARREAANDEAILGMISHGPEPWRCPWWAAIGVWLLTVLLAVAWLQYRQERAQALQVAPVYVGADRDQTELVARVAACLASAAALTPILGDAPLPELEAPQVPDSWSAVRDPAALLCPLPSAVFVGPRGAEHCPGSTP